MQFTIYLVIITSNHTPNALSQSGGDGGEIHAIRDRTAGSCSTHKRGLFVPDSGYARTVLVQEAIRIVWETAWYYKLHVVPENLLREEKKEELCLKDTNLDLVIELYTHAHTLLV